MEPTRLGVLERIELRARRRRNRRARRRRVRMVVSLLTLVGLAVAYVLVTAAWQAADEPWIGFTDLLIPRAMDALIIAWFFFIGASIGSFLNVVAWRMPRGMSINGRSHCPSCANRLSWRDNVPVLGWIVLGGRCRWCGLPISPRYPIVEAAVGGCVLLVALRTYLTDGANLPYGPPQPGRAGVLWMPPFSLPTVGMILYQIVVVSAAWALALVRFDGVRIPRKLAVWCLGLVSVPVLVVPYLAVVPWTVDAAADWRASGDYLNAVLRVLTALAMAGLLGRMLARYLCPTADPKLDPLGEGTARLLDLILLLAVATIPLGWQAGLAVAALAVGIAAVFSHMTSRVDDGLAKFAVGLPIALSIQLAYWKFLHELSWWPSVNTAAAVTLIWGAALLLLPRLLVSAPINAPLRTATEPVGDPGAPD